MIISTTSLPELIRLLRAGLWEGETGNSFTNHRPELVNERRQIIDYRCPHHTEIYGLVIMNQPVAHSYDVTPWNFRMFAAGLTGNAIGRLAYNFHQFYQSELHYLVLFQLILACRAQYFYGLGGIDSHGNKTHIVIIRAHTELRLNRQSLP